MLFNAVFHLHFFTFEIKNENSSSNFLEKKGEQSKKTCKRSKKPFVFTSQFFFARPYAPVRWWIQDFLEGGANSRSGCANLLFCIYFTENWALVPGAPLNPQMQPITLLVFNNPIYIKSDFSPPSY